VQQINIGVNPIKTKESPGIMFLWDLRMMREGKAKGNLGWIEEEEGGEGERKENSWSYT